MMRVIKSLVILSALLLSIVACKKDDSAYLELSATAIYFNKWGDAPKSISYVPIDCKTVAVNSITEGWSAVIDGASRRIIVTATGVTENEDTELSTEGSLVVNALSKSGEATSYFISLYVCEEVVLDTAGRANCYVITKPSTSYAFDVVARPDGAALPTDNVELLWQSNQGVIKSVNFAEGKARFYVQAMEDGTLEPTNAVIAAYDDFGDIIWSWHLWVTAENPLDEVVTYSNGKSFMKRNLGAYACSDGSSDEQLILDSYGMYYQWGRKDPFIRPYFYDASGADEETGFDEVGVYSLTTTAESDDEDGTIEYAIENPRTFITNASCIEEGGDGVGDWMYTPDNTLWSDTEKSVYDPCPAGWRVPTAQDIAVLRLADEEDNTDLEVARKQFGWHLSDGVSKYFYSACGLRRYTDGKIQNMNYKEGVYPQQSQPWEGHYWTSTTTGDGKAISLYFDLTTTRTINKFNAAYPDRRANGKQVRCVKVQ